MRLSFTPKNLAPVPYAIFEEIKGKKFTDFAEVKQNIITLTDKIAGAKKNIVDIPIILSVYGPNCPDLTLVGSEIIIFHLSYRSSRNHKDPTNRKWAT